MSWYLGITVGPIGETLSNAFRPAGLWFCSTFFSDLTRRLCSSFTEKYGKDINILSPYFTAEDNQLFLTDGVGKYHDRIVIKFKGEHIGEELDGAVKEIINNVKKTSKENFTEEMQREPKAEMFLRNYLQVHYVLVEKDDSVFAGGQGNILLELSPSLDALELMQTYPSSEEGNLFRKILIDDKKNGDKDGKERNKKIKSSVLLKKVNPTDNQLLKDGNMKIWSIGEIANCHNNSEIDTKLKKYSYFAVVQADGDNMGKLLKQISAEEDIKNFSLQCLDYAKCAAKQIGEYGGMTIYAGGDDLLFLAPVENAVGRTVFDLCIELNELFVNKMKLGKSGAEDKLSLSFGIAVQHQKFPLYEALNKAGNLLFGTAKQGNKKAMAVELEKHSGQTIKMLMPLAGYNEVQQKYRAAKDLLKDCNRPDMMANSVIQTLSKHSKILMVLDKEALNKIAAKEDFCQQYLKAWSNFQDNVGQKEISSYYHSVGKLYYDCFLQKNCGIECLELESEQAEKTLQALIAFLKMEKFLQEKCVEGE